MSQHQIHQVRADLIRLGLSDSIEVAMLVYLACISRFLPRPLSMILDGAAASGKSTILSTVLSLVPSADVRQFNFITRAALLRQGDGFRNKVLVLHESIDDPEILSPLRQLSSEGSVTYAFFGGEVTLRGPTPILETTTSSQRIDFQNRSRAFVLNMHHSASTLEARFHEIKKRRTTLKTTIDAELDEIRRRHERIQCPATSSLGVVIPYAERIRFQSSAPHAQRLLESFLSLVCAIAWTDKWQRQHITSEFGEQFIEANIEDYAEACHLVRRAPIDTGSDLFPEQSAELLVALKQNGFASPTPFTRLQITSRCSGWTAKRVRTWIPPLIDADILTVRSRGTNRREYSFTEAGIELPASKVFHNCFRTLSAPEELI